MSDEIGIVERLRLAEGAFLNCMDGTALYDEHGEWLVAGGFWVDIDEPGLLNAAAAELLRLRHADAVCRKIVATGAVDRVLYVLVGPGESEAVALDAGELDYLQQIANESENHG